MKRKWESNAQRQAEYRARKQDVEAERNVERAAYVIMRDEMVQAHLIHETANTTETLQKFRELLQYYCDNPLAEYTGWNGCKMDAAAFECEHGFAP